MQNKSENTERSNSPVQVAADSAKIGENTSPPPASGAVPCSASGDWDNIEVDENGETAGYRELIRDLDSKTRYHESLLERIQWVKEFAPKDKSRGWYFNVLKGGWQK